jgi:hypothetical protein
LPDGRLRITASIPARNLACPQLFRLTLGAVRAMPRILDLPDAAASAEIGDRQVPKGALVVIGFRGPGASAV